MVRLVFRPYTKFDDRFARQNRYEPPPGVSSGFTLFRHVPPSFGSHMHAPPRIRSQKVWSGRRCPPLEGPNLSLSLRARFFHPNTRGHVRLLGPCFKTGRFKALRQHPSTRRGAEAPTTRACRVPRSDRRIPTRDYKHTPKGATFPSPLSDDRIDAGPSNQKSAPSEDRKAESRTTD